jgi:hypothetical protein
VAPALPKPAASQALRAVPEHAPWSTWERSPEAGARPERAHRKRGSGTVRTTLSLDSVASQELEELSRRWRLSKAATVSRLLHAAHEARESSGGAGSLAAVDADLLARVVAQATTAALQALADGSR